jgi:hypothetical protein
MRRFEKRLRFGTGPLNTIHLGVTLQNIWTEVCQSARGLRRNPGLTVLGALMLALGMGASIAMVSIVQAALLKPLPFRNSGSIVELWETRRDRGIDQASFSEANFWDVRAQNRSFEELAAYHYGEANLTGAGPAEKVTVSSVTAGFFRTLGVLPVLGRDFSYDDDRGGWNNSVAIAGNRFWRNRFAGDSSILGRTLRLNGRPYTVNRRLAARRAVADRPALCAVWLPRERQSRKFGIPGGWTSCAGRFTSNSKSRFAANCWGARTSLPEG